MTILVAEDTYRVATIQGAAILQSGAEPAWARPSRRTARLVVIATTLALLGIEADVIGPYVSRAAHSLSTSDLRWVLLALLAELLSMVAFAHLQRQMLFAGGTKVRLRSMIGLTYAANALSATLPAGSALSSGYTFRRLRGLGASAPLAGFTLITTGVLSTAAFALLALAGSVVIGLDRMNPAMLSAEVVAAVGLAYLTHRVIAEPNFLRRAVSAALAPLNRAMRRPSGTGEAAVHEFLRGLSEIKPRTRDWGAGLGFSAANWFTDLVCLTASCRAMGIHVSIPLVIVAFLAGATASSLSFLPGGLGVVDAALIVTLTRGGIHVAPAAAAVVLYRLISFVLMVALGWLAWTVNWRCERAQAYASPALEASPALDTHSRRPQTSPRLQPVRRPTPSRRPRPLCSPN